MIQLAQRVRGVLEKTARSYLRRQWFEQYASVVSLNSNQAALAVIRLLDDKGEEITRLEKELSEGHGKWSSVVTIPSKDKPAKVAVTFQTSKDGKVNERTEQYVANDVLTVHSVKEFQMGTTLLGQNYRDRGNLFGLITLRRPQSAQKPFGEQNYQWYGWKSR